MKERPIIFSAEMVRAILAGNKTQTRRVINPQPNIPESAHPVAIYELSRDVLRDCKYKIGDRLWVREKFSISGNGYFYSDESDGTVNVAWSSPIHMPREASRITLEIVNVRVERLHEIKAMDVISEGVQFERHASFERGGLTPCDEIRAYYAFSDGWNKLNAKRGFSWESNPWVWVIEFKKITT